MSPDMLPLLIKSFWETCYMVLASTILATVIGIPLGVILTVTRRDHILPNAAVNSILGAIVNATRSTPFIILMVAIIPLTRIIVGSSIGTTAAIVPLTISAAPFIARIIESSLLEIDHGVIEAAQAMGASSMTPFHHRRPGIVGAAWNTDAMCELICDNVHSHPAAQCLTYRLKGLDHLILITDSMLLFS